MTTIEDLKREIEHEKNKMKWNEEIEERGREREKLEKELKDLKFKNKFGKAHEAGERVFGNIKNAFGELQKGMVDKNEKGGLFR